MSAERSPDSPSMSWKRGLCGVCPAGCWIEAGIEDGRLVAVRADPSHTLGMICRRGEHAPEIVYSEHRLRYPMKRTGPKKTWAFERISWDEAYDRIVVDHDGEQRGRNDRADRGALLDRT